MNTQENPRSIWTRNLVTPRTRLLLWLFLVAAILALELFPLVTFGDIWHWRNPNAVVALGIAILITGGAAGVLLFAIVIPARWRQRLFHRAMLGRYVFLLACLATLIALIALFENWRGKRAWDKYARAKAAQGESLRLSDLIPPPIPDEQNLAMAPLLKPVLDFEYRVVLQPGGRDTSNRELVWRDTNGLQHLEGLSPRWPERLSWTMNRGSNAVERNDRIREAAARLNRNGFTNGWINFIAWQQYYATATNLPGVSAAHDVLAALGHTDADILELSRDAERRPLTRWPIQYGTEPALMILLPQLTHERTITDLLQLRAAAHLGSGDVESAFSEITLAIRLADSSRNEPFLISHLVRLKCYDLLLQPVKEGLTRHQFSDVQLASLQAKLEEADLLAGYNLVAQGERAMQSTWSTHLNEDVIADLVRKTESSFIRPFVVYAWFMRATPKGWAYQNQLTACRFLDDHVFPAIDLEKRRIRPQQARAVESISEQTGFYSMQLRLSLEFDLWEFHSLPGRFGYAQWQVDAAVMACGLERYRLRHGQYPSMLNSLLPEFTSFLPHDLVTGEPLRYRQTEDGRYLLYSVGSNGTDEGGRLVLDSEGEIDPDAGDWVWAPLQRKGG
jgi:hypothetical protein